MAAQETPVCCECKKKSRMSGCQWAFCEKAHANPVHRKCRSQCSTCLICDSRLLYTSRFCNAPDIWDESRIKEAKVFFRRLCTTRARKLVREEQQQAFHAEAYARKLVEEHYSFGFHEVSYRTIAGKEAELESLRATFYCARCRDWRKICGHAAES